MVRAAFTPIYLTRESVFDYVTGTKEAAGSSKVVAAVMQQSWRGIQYAILCCQECESLFVVTDSLGDKGWRVVHPIPHKPVAKDIPEPAKSEFEEANLCYAVRAYKACASMCQRTLESLCQNKKVSGLSQLLSDGIISKALFDRATEIRLWAGIIKHQRIESVSKEDAEQLLTYLEVILNDIYVEPKRLESLTQKRKELKKGN